MKAQKGNEEEAELRVQSRAMRRAERRTKRSRAMRRTKPRTEDAVAWQEGESEDAKRRC